MRPYCLCLAFLLSMLLFGGQVKADVFSALVPVVESVTVQITATGEWARGEWVKAILHLHSWFSDGGFSIEENVRRARELGAKVVFVSDHAEMINTKWYNSLNFYTSKAISPSLAFSRHYGTENYFAAIKAARAKYPDVVIVAGIEGGCGLKRHCHVGFYSSDWDVLRFAIALFEKSGNNDEEIPQVLQALKERGGQACFIIANHMTGTYSFPKEYLRYVDGVEIQNHVVTIDGSDNPLAVWDCIVNEEQQRERRGDKYHLAIVAGADYHGEQVEIENRVLNVTTPSLQYFPSLQRFTMIHMVAHTPQGAIDALQAGTAYAAFGNALITKTNEGMTDQGDVLEFGVAGLDQKFGKEARFVAVECSTGRVSTGVTSMWSSEARIIVPLRSTLKPELGNHGWWICLNIGNQIFTKWDFINPYGQEKVAQADSEFSTPADWYAATAPPVSVDSRPAPRPSSRPPAPRPIPTPIPPPTSVQAPSQAASQSNEPDFLDQLFGLATKLWGVGFFGGDGGQNPPIRFRPSGTQVVQPPDQFYMRMTRPSR